MSIALIKKPHPKSRWGVFNKVSSPQDTTSHVISDPAPDPTRNETAIIIRRLQRTSEFLSIISSNDSYTGITTSFLSSYCFECYSISRDFNYFCHDPVRGNSSKITQCPCQPNIITSLKYCQALCQNLPMLDKTI